MRHVILATAISVLLGCSSSGPGGGGGDSGPPGPHGWMSTSGGSFAATSDGLHFVQRSSPTTQDLFSIVCVGHQLGWAAGGRGALHPPRRRAPRRGAEPAPHPHPFRRGPLTRRSEERPVGEAGRS